MMRLVCKIVNFFKAFNLDDVNFFNHIHLEHVWEGDIQMRLNSKFRIHITILAQASVAFELLGSFSLSDEGIGSVQAFHMEGCDFESQPSQTNDI